jgi:hypothetical protein
MKMLKQFFLILSTFLISLCTYAQTVSGNVDSEDGPLPGATIQVKGTNIASSTDFDGNFSIEANQGDILIISFVGFNSEEVKLENQDTIIITLSPSTELDEVVETRSNWFNCNIIS